MPSCNRKVNVYLHAKMRLNIHKKIFPISNRKFIQALDKQHVNMSYLGCAVCHNKQCRNRSGLKVKNLFSCSTQMSMKSILLLNIKMPTVVGILIFINRINRKSVSFKALFCSFFWYTSN